jgi:hypothetical protein
VTPSGRLKAACTVGDGAAGGDGNRLGAKGVAQLSQNERLAL